VTRYRVTWEIDVESEDLDYDRLPDTARGAAQWADRLRHDPEYDNACVYSVAIPAFPALAAEYVDLSDTPEPVRGPHSYDRPSIQ